MRMDFNWSHFWATGPELLVIGGRPRLCIVHFTGGGKV